MLSLLWHILTSKALCVICTADRATYNIPILSRFQYLQPSFQNKVIRSLTNSGQPVEHKAKPARHQSMKPALFFRYHVTINRTMQNIVKQAYILFYTVWLTEERVFKQLCEIEVSVLNVITIICKLFYVFCTAGMEMTLQGWNVIPH